MSMPRAAAGAAAVSVAGEARSEGTGDFSRRLRRLALAVFAAAFAVAVYAAIERRAYYADGAHYLVRLLTAESFDFSEPARYTALFLLQAPTVLVVRIGLVDLAGAGFVYCLTLELVPLGLLALCYAALPAERKHFFFFPLLAHLAGTLGASAAPVLESLTAVAYFWLLFVVVVFRPLHGVGWVGLAALALPALLLHEVMAGVAPVLAIAAAWRARRETAGARRAAFWALALWFAAVAAVQMGFILVPRSAENRANVLAGFFEFWWLVGRDGSLNFAAWMGLAALLFANLIPLTSPVRPGGREPRAAWWLAAACASLIAIAAAVTALSPRTVFPYQHFAARLVPALVTLALAAGALGSLWNPRRQRWWARPSILAVCAALTAGCLAWHAVAITHWSSYVAILRTALAQSPGLISPAELEAGLTGRERDIFRNMKWSWAFPEISIALAPGGRVAAMIDRETAVPWQTWYPRDPGQLPRSRFFEFAEYRRALAAGPPARAR